MATDSEGSSFKDVEKSPAHPFFYRPLPFHLQWKAGMRPRARRGRGRCPAQPGSPREQLSLFEAFAWVSTEMPGLFFDFQGERLPLNNNKEQTCTASRARVGARARGLTGCFLSFFFISSWPQRHTLEICLKFFFELEFSNLQNFFGGSNVEKSGWIPPLPLPCNVDRKPSKGPREN